MPRLPWKGRTVLISSGPTREYLDPIRYLTNSSSGRMGRALARAARELGAKVVVVSGPGSGPSPPGVSVVPVVTALDMRREVLARADKADVYIGAAAVGDWRFPAPARRKIKRNAAPLRLTLVPNPDILRDLGKRSKRPFLVGFALETDRWLENARKKLAAKRLDLIVANRSSSIGSGKIDFAVLSRRGCLRRGSRFTKERAAKEILRCVVSHGG